MHKYKNYSLLFFIIVTTSFIILNNSQICSQSHYFNGQRCAPCKLNCICTSQNTCSECLSGYAYDTRFQNCLQCPTATDGINIGCKQCCSQISQTAFICSSCVDQPYTFLKGGQCLKIEGCLKILQNGVCETCQPIGFYLEQGKCLACHPSCQSCKDSTLCIACQDQYFNQTNMNYALCESCNTGCLTCSSALICITCIQGYYLSSTSCLACGNNCLSCTSGGCSICDSSSTLISDLCYLCTSALKSGSSGCSSCETVSNLISCKKCNDGYYLSNGQCILCGITYPNSNRCTSTNILQCQNDFHTTLSSRYYLVNSVCVSNTKQCKVMQASNGDCSECYFDGPDSYYRLSNKICTKCSQTGCKIYNKECQCLECLNGYRYVNNFCVACQNLHCIKCQQEVQSCEKCSPFYGRFSSACIACTKANCINCDGDYKSCITCEDSYYLSTGTCYKCQTNCLLCETNTKCTKCASTYYLQNNGRCKQLPSNCLQINSNYLNGNIAVCKKCKYGYQIILGSCYPCSQSLFNLNKCQKYCPTYYALLKFNPQLFSVEVLSFFILILMSF